MCIRDSFLDELTHGVQVSGEDAACWEQALVVLALALAEQLLIPLVHQGEVGLVALQDLTSLALELCIRDSPGTGQRP